MPKKRDGDIPDNKKDAGIDYGEVLESSMIGFCRVTQKGRLICANKAAAAMLGYESPGALIDSISHIATQVCVNPEDWKRALKIMEERGCLRDFEVPCRRIDGGVLWCLLNGLAVRDSAGNVLYYEGTGLDITRMKEAWDALKKSEEKYRAMFRDAPMSIYRTSLEGRYLDVNPRGALNLGFESPEELIQSVTDIVTQIYASPDDRKEILRRLMEGGEVENFEAQIRKKDGSIVWHTLNLCLVRDKKGDILHVIGTAQDITELKEAREALEKSENQYRDLTEMTTDWVWEIDNRGKFIYSNDKVFDCIGLTPDEVMGKSPIELAAPEEQEFARAVFYDKKAFTGLHNTCIHRDGRLVFLDVNGLPIFDEQGVFIKYRGVTRDITSLKEAEMAFRKSEGRFRRLAENAPAMIFRLSIPEGVYEYVSPASTAVTGCTPKEIYNSPPCAMGNNPYWTGYMAGKWNRIKKGKVSTPPPPEHKIIHRSGGERWVYQRNTLERDCNGRPVALEGIVMDITERKRLEEELRDRKDILEREVAEQTAELRRSNKKLESKTLALQDMNTALKVLIKHSLEEKKDIEGRIASNIKSLVLPYVEKVMKGRLDPRQRDILAIVESNLNEIVSPLSHDVHHFNFTPRETQTATLVRDGKSTKEISEIIGVGVDAVNFYRKMIRKKLKLNRGTNLHTFLKSLK